MINYVFVILSCLMRACQIGTSKAYSVKYGTENRAVYRCAAISGFSFVAFMCIKAFISQTPFKMTWFSFVLAIILGIINAACIIFIYGGYKYGQVSRVTLFMNLGILLIPTIFGFFYSNEPVTLGKIICLVLVSGALLLNLDLKAKDSSKKAIAFYVVIFAMNGLACVAQSIHQKNIWGFTPASENDFITVMMFFYAVISIMFLGFIYAFKPVKQEDTKKVDNLPFCIGIASADGILAGSGVLFSTISLAYIPASVQNPLITGGGVILGGIVGRVFGEKIDLKFVISAILVIVGTICLGVI